LLAYHGAGKTFTAAMAAWPWTAVAEQVFKFCFWVKVDRHTGRDFSVPAHGGGLRQELTGAWLYKLKAWRKTCVNRPLLQNRQAEGLLPPML
jgi:hypothetical protein